MFEARIIQDSICNGQRLTTMQVTMPRMILAEWNTHCAFARNCSSSRAIPFKKMVQRVIETPFIPTYWGQNQSGMQSFSELTGLKREAAIVKWLEARDNAVKVASDMANETCTECFGKGIQQYIMGGRQETCKSCNGDGLGLNLHKQVVNRLLEPWMWATNCTTGDANAWSNFFALRCDKDAEPHMQRVAYLAQKAYFTSTPQELLPGQWHTPYIRPEEYKEIDVWESEQRERNTEFDGVIASEKFCQLSALVQISTGRCARTSYLSQEGIRNFGEDIKLHDRLRYHVPLHASPFEHVCQAKGDGQRYAKYIGWQAYRSMLPCEYVTDFKPNHPELTHG